MGKFKFNDMVGIHLWRTGGSTRFGNIILLKVFHGLAVKPLEEGGMCCMTWTNTVMPCVT